MEYWSDDEDKDQNPQPPSKPQTLPTPNQTVIHTTSQGARRKVPTQVWDDEEDEEATSSWGRDEDRTARSWRDSDRTASQGSEDIGRSRKTERRGSSPKDDMQLKSLEDAQQVRLNQFKGTEKSHRVSGFEFKGRSDSSEHKTIDPTQIFTKLVREFGGKAPPNKLRRLFPRDYSNDKIISWFRDHDNQFIVYESDQGVVSGISVRVSGIKICNNYNARQGCRLLDCQFLHVCNYFAMGHCIKGTDCDKSHNYRDARNQDVLEVHELENFDSNDLQTIMQMSTLTVCQRYNNSNCSRDSSCHFLHVCRGFITNRCQLEDCRFDHDFDSLHSQRLLQVFGLDQERNITLVKKNIRFSRIHMNNHQRGKWEKEQNRTAAGGRVTDGTARRTEETRGREGAIRKSDSSYERRSRSSSSGRITPRKEDGYIKNEVDSIKTNLDKLKRSQLSKSSTHLPTAGATGANKKTKLTEKVVAIHLDDSKSNSSSDSDSDVNWHIEKERKLKPSKLPKPKEEKIHKGNDIEICLKHISGLTGKGGCPNGKGCFDHHVNMIYTWQALVFGDWETLTIENETIEEHYCKPRCASKKFKVSKYKLLFFLQTRLQCIFLTITTQ